MSPHAAVHVTPCHPVEVLYVENGILSSFNSLIVSLSLLFQRPEMAEYINRHSNFTSIDVMRLNDNTHEDDLHVHLH